MSIAAMSVRWLCRKLRQVGEGTLGRHGMYLPTVAWQVSPYALSCKHLEVSVQAVFLIARSLKSIVIDRSLVRRPAASARRRRDGWPAAAPPQALRAMTAPPLPPSPRQNRH